MSDERDLASTMGTAMRAEDGDRAEYGGKRMTGEKEKMVAWLVWWKAMERLFSGCRRRCLEYMRAINADVGRARGCAYASPPSYCVQQRCRRDLSLWLQTNKADAGEGGAWSTRVRFHVNLLTAGGGWAGAVGACVYWFT